MLKLFLWAFLSFPSPLRRRGELLMLVGSFPAHFREWAPGEFVLPSAADIGTGAETFWMWGWSSLHLHMRQSCYVLTLGYCLCKLFAKVIAVYCLLKMHCVARPWTYAKVWLKRKWYSKKTRESEYLLSQLTVFKVATKCFPSALTAVCSANALQAAFAGFLLWISHSFIHVNV